MGCKYDNGVLIFSEDAGVCDGEYIIVNNQTDDFSLYTDEQFQKFTDNLKEKTEKDSEDEARKVKLYLRYILARAELVTVSDCKLELSDINQERITVPSLAVTKHPTHISIVGSAQLYKMIKDADRLKEILSQED